MGHDKTRSSVHYVTFVFLGNGLNRDGLIFSCRVTIVTPPLMDTPSRRTLLDGGQISAPVVYYGWSTLWFLQKAYVFYNGETFSMDEKEKRYYVHYIYVSIRTWLALVWFPSIYRMPNRCAQVKKWVYSSLEYTANLRAVWIFFIYIGPLHRGYDFKISEL